MTKLLAATLLSLVTLAALSACTETPAPSTPTASSSAFGAQLQGNGQGPDANPDRPLPVDSPECQFRVAQACYLNADAACKAAGCERSACTILESMPAQVQCKK